MGRATKVKVRCGILDGAALDCARQEFWALFVGVGGGSLVSTSEGWCRGGAGLGDCWDGRARPSSCRVVVMVVDTRFVADTSGIAGHQPYTAGDEPFRR